jgi:hypothetical protein
MKRTPITRKTPLRREGKAKVAIRWDADGICRHGRRRGDCRQCIALRNRTFGRQVQREMHQALGGTGFSPTHEESGRGYDVEFNVEDVSDAVTVVKVHPEAKGGQQIPASFAKAFGTEWWRRALSQSSRSVPVGSGAKPAVWLHMPGGHRYLIIDYGGGK